MIRGTYKILVALLGVIIIAGLVSCTSDRTLTPTPAPIPTTVPGWMEIELTMGAHSGTHVDAPIHFVKEGKSVYNIPLGTVVGRARVIEIRAPESIKPKELVGHRIQSGERILFKTENSSHIWQKDEFVEDFVFISDTAADFLVNRGVRLIGIDHLSVGSFKHGGSYVHKTLLSGGIWIIEGLNLSNVTPGKYDLICLPLRIIAGDGAPARAILRPVVHGKASI